MYDAVAALSEKRSSFFSLVHSVNSIRSQTPLVAGPVIEHAIITRTQGAKGQLLLWPPNTPTNSFENATGYRSSSPEKKNKTIGTKRRPFDAGRTYPSMPTTTTKRIAIDPLQSVQAHHDGALSCTRPTTYKQRAKPSRSHKRSRDTFTHAHRSLSATCCV